MESDVTRLRNIGIVTSIDAGHATCRQRIVELTGAPGPASRSLGARAAASSGSWRPRSGPFVDEPITLTIVDRASGVFDGALLVLDGARGAAETAEVALRETRARVPCVALVDEVGDVEALEAMLGALEAELGIAAVAVHAPWHDEGGAYVLDVLEQRLVVEDGAERGLRPLPAAARPMVARLRRRVVDVCAEVDDAIHGASAAGLDVDAATLARALRRATLASKPRALVVSSGSLRARRGVGLLLDALATYMPSPAERPPSLGVDPRRRVAVARFPREEDALAALAFATADVPPVGRLTWLRVYSGRMDASAKVVVLPRHECGNVERIFAPEARGLREIESAGPGAIVGVTGVRDARPGDTLSCVRAPVVLAGSPAAASGVPAYAR